MYKFLEDTACGYESIVFYGDVKISNEMRTEEILALLPVRSTIFGDI